MDKYVMHLKVYVELLLATIITWLLFSFGNQSRHEKIWLGVELTEGGLVVRQPCSNECHTVQQYTGSSSWTYRVFNNDDVRLGEYGGRGLEGVRGECDQSTGFKSVGFTVHANQNRTFKIIYEYTLRFVTFSGLRINLNLTSYCVSRELTSFWCRLYY